jgi:hypothetical protein
MSGHLSIQEHIGPLERPDRTDDYQKRPDHDKNPFHGIGLLFYQTKMYCVPWKKSTSALRRRSLENGQIGSFFQKETGMAFLYSLNFLLALFLFLESPF